MRYWFLAVFFMTAYLNADSQNLDDIATAAREKNLESFVVTPNGDTIKGKTLKKKHNPISGKDRWYMDGKEISMQGVKIWQDKYAFHEGIYIRLLKGKASLFVTGTPLDRGTYTGTIVQYYMKHIRTENEEIISRKYIFIEMWVLREYMKDCGAASEQIEKEFAGEKNNATLLDYKKLIKVFNTYNNCF